jgi:Tol biopolymer transport system component
MAHSRMRRRSTGPHESAWLGWMGLACTAVFAFAACGTGQTVSGTGLGSTPSAPPTAIVEPASPATGPTSTISTAPSASANAVASGEEWISFQWAGSDEADAIILIRPDGTGRHQLVPDLAGKESHPDWSPDGQHIAFVHSTPSDRSELWVVDADGTDARMVASCDLPCNTFNYPDWAPDGGAIYYGFDSDAQPNAPPTTFGVGRYDIVTGTNSTVLTRKDGMTAEQPRISPDGKQVVYDRAPLDGTGGLALYVADLVGGPERRLTDPSLYASHPDWAGERIIFNTYDLGFFQDTTEAANLYSVAADGSDLRKLTAYGRNDTRATQPRVSPDGTTITYTQVDGPGWGTRRMAAVDLDGANRRWLTPEPLEATHPQLRPIP